MLPFPGGMPAPRTGRDMLAPGSTDADWQNTRVSLGVHLDPILTLLLGCRHLSP